MNIKILLLFFFASIATKGSDVALNDLLKIVPNVSINSYTKVYGDKTKMTYLFFK